MRESSVTNAFAKWSACMRRSGFGYATPLDAMNDRRFETAAPTGLEKSVAHADAVCKQQTNVIAVWYAADVALESLKIAAAGAGMVTTRRGITAELRAATQVLRAAGVIK